MSEELRRKLLAFSDGTSLLTLKSELGVIELSDGPKGLTVAGEIVLTPRLAIELAFAINGWGEGCSLRDMVSADDRLLSE